MLETARRLVEAVADAATAEAHNPTKELARKLGGGNLGDELRVLASNFLLYVTLVIACAGLQHYYFPDSIARAHVVPETETADDNDEEPLVDEQGAGPPSPLARRSSTEAIASLFDDTKFNQEHATKKEVLTRLGVCVAGLLISFLVWGVLQERMLTKPYDGDYFTSSYGLVFLNRLGGFLISGAMLWTFAPPGHNAIAYRFAFPSVSNMLSSWCQYEALKYVSFPVQMLGKSAKMVPVMVWGVIVTSKKYKLHEWVISFGVTGGCMLFGMSGKINSARAKQEDSMSLSLLLTLSDAEELPSQKDWIHRGSSFEGSVFG